MLPQNSIPMRYHANHPQTSLATRQKPNRNLPDTTTNATRPSPPIGHLPLTGALHEGASFTAWKAALSADLVKNYSFTLDDTTHPNFQTDTIHQLFFHNLINNQIRNSLSETLRARLPRRADAKTLLPLLETMAAPFDLMALPSELRVRVFELHFRSDREHGFGQMPKCPWTVVDEDGVRASPALLLVSKALRAEGLPEFYRTAWFSLVLRRDRGLGGVERIARLWNTAVTEKMLRNLRKVRVQVWRGQEPWVAELGFSRNGGLRLLACQGLLEPFRLRAPGTADVRALERFVGGIEKVRAERELQGEAILMALLAWGRAFDG
ncbi:hypothetical protein MBLNU230_g0725t1 [Neophaeotheca triangularis]